MPHDHLLPRRQLALAGAFSLVLGSAAAQPKAAPLSTAINRSGKMRALSQRVSKAYVQVTLDVLPEKALDVVVATQRIMKSTLDYLGGAPASAEVRSALALLARDVEALNAVIGAKPKHEAVLGVAKAADEVLADAESATRAIQDTSRQASARIVNLAGRQRMLSQRAARAYFLQAAGKDAPAFRKQGEEAREEFKRAMVTLQAAPISTPAIRSELELAQAQWVFYEAALLKKPTPEGLSTVATTSERIFEVMDNLTSMYDTALRDVLS